MVFIEEQLYSIKISDNGLFVYLELHQRQGANSPKITIDKILAKLKELKVRIGVNKKIIKKSLKKFYANNIPPPPPPILIAKGLKACNQQAIGIQWFIEPHVKHEYERVVAPDQAIASTLSVKVGKPGKDVFGQTIPIKTLPDQSISTGEGVYQKTIKKGKEQDQVVYYSNYLGMIYLIGEKLCVKPLIHVMNPPFSAEIELYGFLGDEIHSKVIASHIVETLRRLNITHGWKSKQLIRALSKAHKRSYKDLEHDVSEKLILVSSTIPIEPKFGKIQWKINKSATEPLEKLVYPGQTIARYKCLSEGKSGIDIYGNKVSPKKIGTKMLKEGEGVQRIKQKNFFKYKAQYIGLIDVNDRISLQSLSSVSADKLIAYFQFPIFPHNSPHKPINLSQVQITLEYNSICYGIQRESINTLLAAIQTGKQLADNNSQFFRAVVANGKKPKDGIDARIELNQQISAGKIMQNGRIDYKERSYPWNVKKGDVIGKYIPMVPQEDGRDVYNRVIPAKKPKDFELNLDGLHKDPSGTLFSDKVGTLIVHKHNLAITDFLVLDGDVDNITGNIHSESTVIVKGYVDAGFSVETAADLTVDANVENAKIKAKGNIIIRGGVRGSGSKIDADGEVNVSFMEHAKVRSRSSIVILESIIDCDLMALDEVIIGENKSRKASIVGGITHGYKKVISGNIGNDSFIKTNIIAGYLQKDLDKHEKLANEIERNQKELEQIEQMYTQGSAGASGNINQMMEKLEPLGRQIESQKIEFEALTEKIEASKSSTVEIHNTAYPGVTITICCHSLTLIRTYKNGEFLLKNNKIQFNSY